MQPTRISWNSPAPARRSSERPQVSTARRRAVDSSSLATRAVQPVWWLAPRPAPVSPWKYSKNSEVVVRRVARPDRPPRTRAVGRRRRAGRSSTAAPDRSSATVPSVTDWPEPVGYSTEEVVAVVVVELLERLDQQVVDREPDRAAPVRVAAEQSRPRLGRLVVDGARGRRRGRARTGARDGTG